MQRRLSWIPERHAEGCIADVAPSIVEVKNVIPITVIPVMSRPRSMMPDGNNSMMMVMTTE